MHPNDVIISISPCNYIRCNRKDDTFCINMYFKKHGKGSTLGSNTITGYDVHFDIDYNRIGFIESSCNYDYPFQVIHPTIIITTGNADVNGSKENNSAIVHNGNETNQHVHAIINENALNTTLSVTILQNNAQFSQYSKFTLLFAIVIIFFIIGLLLHHKGQRSYKPKISNNDKNMKKDKRGMHAPMPTSTNQFDIDNNTSVEEDEDDDNDADMMHVELVGS